MNIKNIFGETIIVTDLDAAIKDANTCLGIAWKVYHENKGCHTDFISKDDRQYTIVGFHSHNLKELLKLLPPLVHPDWLFIGTFPTCYVYCDKRKQEDGYYKTILRLFYNPLRIEIKSNNVKAYPEILELAKERLRRLQMRVHEPLVVTASDQTTGLTLSTGPDVVILKK